MTSMPSEAVRDLLRQGKQNQAMKLYRREGATGQDINYLNTANSIATDRGISIEDALEGILKDRTVDAPSTAPLDDGKAARYMVYGCLWGVCFPLGGVVLILVSSQEIGFALMGGQIAPVVYFGLVALATGVLGAIIFFIAAVMARKPGETTKHRRSRR